MSKYEVVPDLPDLPDLPHLPHLPDLPDLPHLPDLQAMRMRAPVRSSSSHDHTPVSTF
jgi:hypothetical protein